MSDFDWDEAWTGFPDEEPPQRPHREPVSQARRGTVDQIREWRIADGECPRVCPGRLEDNACPVCGWSLLEEQMRERLDAREVVELPEPQMPIDEFAEAQVDAA